MSKRTYELSVAAVVLGLVMVVFGLPPALMSGDGGESGRRIGEVIFKVVEVGAAMFVLGLLTLLAGLGHRLRSRRSAPPQ
jgi:hypothetical protein